MIRIRLRQIASDINNNLIQVEKALEYIKNNQELINKIKQVRDASTDVYKKHTLPKDITYFLASIQKTNPLIKSIHVITEDTHYDSNTRFEYIIPEVATKKRLRSRYLYLLLLLLEQEKFRNLIPIIHLTIICMSNAAFAMKTEYTEQCLLSWMTCISTREQMEETG